MDIKVKKKKKKPIPLFCPILIKLDISHRKIHKIFIGKIISNFSTLTENRGVK